MTDRRFLWPGLVAASIAAADAVFYVVLIQRQGTPAPVVPWVFAALVVTSLAIFWASMNPRNELSPMVLGLATGCLFVLGVLGIFSIGLPLLIASMFCLVATVGGGQPEASTKRLTKAILGGIAVIAVGLALYFVWMGRGGTRQSEIECVSTAGRTRCETYESP